MAIALGPIVGGWLLQDFSWGSIFVAMAPVAALALAGVAVAVPASKSPDGARPDVPGLVLSSAMMALLVFTIIEAPTYGWTAGRSLAGFAVSAVLLAAFVAAERRAPHPMLDVRLFRNPRFSAASGAVTVSFFTLLGFIFLITQYFQFVRGYSALSAGVRLLPVALAVAIGSVAGTQLAVRAGTKLIVTTGLVAMAVFYGWVAATTSASLSYDVIAVQMVLYGLGMGLTSAPATEAIMGVVSRSRAGRRLGRQRRHPAHRGDARRRRARQRLRLESTGRGSPPPPRPGCLARSRRWRTSRSARPTRRRAASRDSATPALGSALRLASTNAFLHGLTVGAVVAGGVAAAGAILTAVFLPAQPAQPLARSARSARRRRHRQEVPELTRKGSLR